MGCHFTLEYSQLCSLTPNGDQNVQNYSFSFFFFSNRASDPSALILIWGEHLFPISFSSVLRELDLVL